MAVLQALLVTLVLFPVTYCLYTYLTSPVRSFPGHWASGYSNIWRLWVNFKQNAQVTHIDLHEKYGSVVRMGPNIVSVNDPAAVKEAFRLRDPWLKVSQSCVPERLSFDEKSRLLSTTSTMSW